MSVQGCTPETCNLDRSLYGYRPSIPAGAMFVSIPILALVASTAITVRTRTGILPCILTCLASVLLVAGWATRIVGWSDPWDFYPFAQGTVMLAIAPVFISSTFYAILKEIVAKLGPEHSFIAPALYPAILLPHDLVAAILQVVGYVVAFPRGGADARGLVPITRAGINTAMAGTALHLATLVATLLFYGSVLLRAHAAYRTYGYTTFDKEAGYVPLPRRFLVTVAVVFPSACACLVGRDVYRIVALAGGLGGSVSRNQALFVGVEGLLVALALLATVLCHPGVVLGDGARKRTDEDAPFVSRQQAGSDLEEMGRVYKEQDAVIERNTSVRVPQMFGSQAYTNV